MITTAGMNAGTHRLRGLSLIEVLVSTLILGVGLVGVSHLYLASVSLYAKSRVLGDATQRVQRELEYVEKIPFDDLTSESLSAYYTVPNYPNAAVTNITGGRRITFNINELPGGHGVINITSYHAYTKLVHVSLAINWTKPDGSSTNVTVYTLISSGIMPPVPGVMIAPATITLYTGSTSSSPLSYRT